MLHSYHHYKKQLNIAIKSNNTRLIAAYEEELTYQITMIERIYGAGFIENYSSLFIDFQDVNFQKSLGKDIGT